ncbi:hypothetical protein [Chryseobacterium sp. T1]
MKVAYSKKRLYTNLILGIFWIVLSIAYYMSIKQFRWNAYLTLAGGLAYIILYILESRKNYFEITDNTLKINSIPAKEIKLDDIKAVNYYAGDFTFITSDKKLKIVQNQINKDQLSEFQDFFKTLNLNLALKKFK